MTEKKNKSKEKKCPECEKNLAGWKRALADYENLKKQIVKEKEAFAKFANLNLIVQLIPVYENLKIALEHAPKNDDWGTGVEHIKNSFKKVLEENSVQEIVPEVGNKFDVETMEAVEDEEKRNKKKEIKENKISKVISAGYKLHDKVFIPAKVIVV